LCVVLGVSGVVRPVAPDVSRSAGIAVADSDPWRAIAIAEDERHWSDDGLGSFLRHRDAVVRSRAALAVGRLQDSTSVPALLPLLADTSLEVRRQAAFALGQIGHRSAASALDRVATASD